MAKQFLLSLPALAFANSVNAQSFPKPADVPAYVSVTPLYKTDGTANTPIDPSVTPPPAAELTNIPIPSNVGRISSGNSYGPGSPYCTIIADGGTCNEYKFRTVIDFSHMLPDDPIRNYGQPGMSHLHCFAGAGSANANSTYKTLRQHSLDSVAAGTDVNGTAYWRPCTVLLNPFNDGKNYALRDDFWTVYYVGTPGTKTTHYPVGLRFVFGFDMDSAWNSTTGSADQYSWLQSILNAANAAQSYTRYTLKNPNSGKYETQATYACSGATPSEVTVLKNADGSDPYGGTCASGASFFIKVDGAKCWDGKNLWSPGGYKHLIPGVWDSTVSKFVCPFNYYMTPALRLEILQTQYGWTDRQRWDLSSDIAYRTGKGLTSSQLPPGTTFHTDWLYGWDSAIFLQALRNCAGADGVQGHECNSSAFSATSYLIGGQANEAGVSRVPQVDLSAVNHTTQAGMMLIPPAWSGSLTNMHLHN